jgi:hypothetical protein
VQKTAAQLSASGIKFYGTLALPPGRYAIKTLVRAGDSALRGFARSDVEVAKAGQMVVSQPFFFEDGGKWLMIKGPSHDKTNAGYPFQVNGQAFIPSAAVRLDSQPRKFAVFIYNASPEDLRLDLAPQTKVVSQIKSADGSKLVFQLDGTPTAPLSVTVKKDGGSEQKVAIPIAMQ